MRFTLTIPMIVLSLLLGSVADRCFADTAISSFEGDLSAGALMKDGAPAVWEVLTPASSSFVVDGTTEGSQALQVLHDQTWTTAMRLDTPELIDIVRQADTLNIDATVDGLNTGWRQVWVIMQGSGLSWSQQAFELLGSDPDGGELALTEISMDLSDSAGDGTGVNFKAAAQAARDSLDADPAFDYWWQMYLVFQGEENDPLLNPNDPQVTTTIDNIRFIGGPAGVSCDSDGDMVCDITDMNALYAANGTSGALDMDGSGTIDANDIDDWLVAAGFGPGDTDLNGIVDSTDLGNVLANFQAGNTPGWGGGDLNLDLIVDSTDLGEVLANFGQTTPLSAAAAAVPEPGTSLLISLAVFGFAGIVRRRR